MVSRRELLGAVTAAGVVAGCAPLAARLRKHAPKEAFALPNVPTHDGVRVFGRLGFGHRPGDLVAYAQDGHDATIERLLRADAKEDPIIEAQIDRLDVFRMEAKEMEDLPREEVLRQLRQAAVLRAVFGANPLLERMADFWSDHFNIYGRKEADAWRKGHDQETVIRSHALGNFQDMLFASARSPAMLGYLDNEKNRKGAPNENYARELMELHTLGVDGGYTQRDIQEVARCFTGWTVEDRAFFPILRAAISEKRMLQHGAFRFDPDRHEGGTKEVLGHKIPESGEHEAEEVLRIVATHPSTGRHLAKKLSLYFLGRRSSDVEDAIAKAYRDSDGDIRQTIRPLVTSGELRHGPPVLKRPMDLMASSVRALDGSTDGWTGIQQHLSAMGQEPYEWPMPDGFPIKTTAWSGSMLPRWSFAFALAADQIPGTHLEGSDLSTQKRLAALLGYVPDAELGALVEAHGLGLAIAAPEFQWK